MVDVNGNARFTNRGALTPPKVPCGAVIQLATHFLPLGPSSLACAPAATSSATNTSFVKRMLTWFVMRVSPRQEELLEGGMRGARPRAGPGGAAYLPGGRV